MTDEEVLDALLALVNEGHAQAYLYDPNSNRYLPVDIDGSPRESLWFMIRK